MGGQRLSKTATEKQQHNDLSSSAAFPHTPRNAPPHPPLYRSLAPSKSYCLTPLPVHHLAMNSFHNPPHNLLHDLLPCPVPVRSMFAGRPPPWARPLPPGRCQPRRAATSARRRGPLAARSAAPPPQDTATSQQAYAPPLRQAPPSAFSPPCIGPGSCMAMLMWLGAGRGSRSQPGRARTRLCGVRSCWGCVGAHALRWRRCTSQRRVRWSYWTRRWMTGSGRAQVSQRVHKPSAL